MEEDSQRRKNLLCKINILRECHPNIVIPETDNMTDDQIELMYVKLVNQINDEEKAKKEDQWNKIISQYAPILMKMFESKPESSSSKKPDFVVHHIIKFEK